MKWFLLSITVAFAIPNAADAQTAKELASTLQKAKVAKHLSSAKRLRYATYIVEASATHGIDPLLVSAVIWTESNFRNLRVNKTNDYGLMQVHWQRVPWLKGIKRRDLYNPRINIYTGVKELAHVKRFCKKRRHRTHNWWGHYLYGPKVKKRWYDRRVARRYYYLRRVFTNMRNKQQPNG